MSPCRGTYRGWGDLEGWGTLENVTLSLWLPSLLTTLTVKFYVHLNDSLKILTGDSNTHVVRFGASNPLI